MVGRHIIGKGRILIGRGKCSYFCAIKSSEGSRLRRRIRIIPAVLSIYDGRIVACGICSEGVLGNDDERIEAKVTLATLAHIRKSLGKISLSIGYGPCASSPYYNQWSPID